MLDAELDVRLTAFGLGERSLILNEMILFLVSVSVKDNRRPSAQFVAVARFCFLVTFSAKDRSNRLSASLIVARKRESFFKKRASFPTSPHSGALCPLVLVGSLGGSVPSYMS